MTANRGVYGGAIVALLGLPAGLLRAAVVGTRGVGARDVRPEATGTNGSEEVYAPGQARRIGEIGEGSNILGVAVPIGRR